MTQELLEAWVGAETVHPEVGPQQSSAWNPSLQYWRSKGWMCSQPAGGLALSLCGTRFLRTQLLGVRSTDMLTYGSVAVLLSILALAVCYIPARRATKVEPMGALKRE